MPFPSKHRKENRNRYRKEPSQGFLGARPLLGPQGIAVIFSPPSEDRNRRKSQSQQKYRDTWCTQTADRFFFFRSQKCAEHTLKDSFRISLCTNLFGPSLYSSPSLHLVGKALANVSTEISHAAGEHFSRLSLPLLPTKRALKG